MKCAHIYALFLVFIFHTSCGQKQTNVPQDNYSEAQLKEAETSKVPMSMVRHVRQARNGDILVASYLGAFRYGGTSFTNLNKGNIYQGELPFLFFLLFASFFFRGPG